MSYKKKISHVSLMKIIRNLFCVFVENRWLISHQFKYPIKLDKQKSVKFGTKSDQNRFLGRQVKKMAKNWSSIEILFLLLLLLLLPFPLDHQNSPLNGSQKPKLMTVANVAINTAIKFIFGLMFFQQNIFFSKKKIILNKFSFQVSWKLTRLTVQKHHFFHEFNDNSW